MPDFCVEGVTSLWLWRRFENLLFLMKTGVKLNLEKIGFNLLLVPAAKANFMTLFFFCLERMG
jgi:hypothetical protein